MTVSAPRDYVIPLFISGNARDGTITENIDKSEAHMLEGNWKFCISSLNLTLSETIANPTHATLSTNLCWNHKGQPSIIHVFIVKGRPSDQLAILSSRSLDWIDISRPTNQVELFFRDLERNNTLPVKKVHAVILLRRIG